MLKGVLMYEGVLLHVDICVALKTVDTLHKLHNSGQTFGTHNNRNRHTTGFLKVNRQCE